MSPDRQHNPSLGASEILWRLALILILAITFYPFLYLVMTSLKDPYQFYHSFWLPGWPPAFDNYAMAGRLMARYLLNSMIITLFSVMGILVCSSLVGFLFARYRFPGRNLLFYGFIVMMMIPQALMLVPSFVWVNRLGMTDTYWVMILPYISGGQVLGIFLMTSTFSQIDRDLFEQVEVDGAGLLRQLWHVGLPLARPMLGVVAIVSALAVWNNYLWPLVTTSSEEVMVLTVGILRYQTMVAGNYGEMFAGYAISAIPLGILFLVATRLFMRGITSGALKA